MDDSSMIYKRSLSSGSESVAINKDVQELTLFWENFLGTNNEKVRIEWLELFMFKYEVLITEPEFNADNQQFLSSIPSHFICYLLKLVYSIISELGVVSSIPITSTNASTSNQLYVPNGMASISDRDAHPLASLPYSTSISMATALGHDEILNELFRDDKDDVSSDCSDESKRNDTKTIAALREFLAKGNGGRMLRILESLDLKGLLCSRELASVLVSFFPRSEWSSKKPVRDIDDVMNNEMADLMKLQNAIDEFEFHTRFYYARSEKSDSTDSLKDGPKKIAHNLHTYYDTSLINSSTVEKPCIPAKVSTDTNPDSFQTDEFNVYEERTQSCDYIGSTILNILQKLITNESNESLVQTSATIKSLWFSIGQYQNIEQNQPFKCVNHEKIKRKLITITFMCLNKIFPSGKKLDELFNVKKLLARLMKAISIDFTNAEQQLRTVNGLMTTDAQRNLSIKIDNLNALVYCLFLIIQNMLINRNGEGNLFDTLFVIMQQNISTLTKCVCLLTKIDRKQKNGHLEKMLHLLLKLIYILSNIEAQQDKTSQEKLKFKRKISILAPPMASAHHKSYKLFKCMLESIVMHMAQEATADKMRIIFTFFRKYTICCCNIDLLLIHRILENSLDNKMHKICLNFIKQNVFRTVFMDDISCFNCDSINFIFEFKENFVSLYKTWFQYLNEPIEVIIFFKHIAKLSKYLHVDIQSHILVDIVLPVFRREKTKIVEQMNGAYDASTVINDKMRTSANNDNDHLSEGSDDDDGDLSDSEIVVDASDFTDKLIICCLNIFLCYLKDVTVIKAFFIEENIQHLDELFVIPQFAYLVSNLLKIGIDNSQFLGETIEERLILCQRLESLQIHLFSNIIDILVDLFNDMSTAFNFKLKQTTKNTDGTGSLMINQPNYILAKLRSNQLTIFEVLHLSVIYWNLILQIIRSSHDEFRGKVEQCLSSYENLQFNLVYNSLSCVLFMIQRQTNNDTINSSIIFKQQQQKEQHQHIQMKQLSAEQQSIDLLNSSIISNLTLNDFEIVTTDELGIDFWSKCNNTKYIHSNNYTLTTTTPQTTTTNDAYQTERSVTERQVNNIFITNQCDIYSNKRFMTCINNERNGIFQLNTEIQLNSNLKMSPNDDCVDCVDCGDCINCDQKINTGSGENELNSSTRILNNVNNGHEPSLIYSSKNNNSNNNTKMLLSSIIERLKSGNSAAPNYNHIHLMIDSVQKLTHFVSKKVFGPIFNNNDLTIGANVTAATAAVVADKQLNVSVNETNDCNDVDKQHLNDTDMRIFDTFNEQQLAPLNTNQCKKLLMQLFEITLGVMLCEYKDRKADIEMSNALQELKQLLLSKTIGATFNTEKTKSIVDALLSLLKVAEMRNKCCFFDDCAHPTLARQNTFSLNISLENDRLLLLTGQSYQNETTTNDFYGQSDTTETDNSYETADEGYDADGEAAKFAETDIESDWSQSTASTAPPFRTHYVHEGICKIVIEILIDLSKRCLSNPNFSLNSLMQIATRLFSIRDVLGGPLYLIKGFANVLETKEVRLRDFQKSILDLITDLTTPDTLCAYLSLMTSESPPLDILLSRLLYLGNQGQSVHPSIEIEFPVACDAEIKHNCDRYTFENIYKIYNGHEMQHIKSPFTQAAYIVPLNNLSFKPWTKDGFTITSWLRLNSDQGSADIQHDQPYSTPVAVEFEKNNDTNICSQHCVCKNKQHFISIGTNAMMLSIYLCVTNVNTMYFQITNPSVASHKGISKSHSEHFRCADSVVVANGTKKPRNQLYNTSTKRRRNYKKETTVNNNTPIRPNRKPRSKENRKKVTEEPTSTSNVLAATRMVLKSSLSHFNLFSLNRQHDKEIESAAVMCPIEIRGVKLHKNRWTLFSLAANFSDGEIQLQIFIDNIPSAQINLPCSNFANDTKKDKISVMCIGHKHSQPMTPLTPLIKIKDFSSPDFIQEATDFEAHSFRYSLSNVLLFRNKALGKEMLANLYALGPDCVNFAQCQIGNLIPNLGMPTTSKVQATIPINEVLRTFREHLLVVYSAHKPDTVIGYKNVDEGEPLDIIRFGCKAIPKYIPSFHTALYLSGGLSPMLYLFARIVELSNSDVVQSAALQFLLKTAHSNSALYTEFIRQNYFSLIGAVIRTDKCLKTIRLLNAVLETACSASIISKGPDGFELSINKNICIVYADLFVGIINHYSDWHDPNADNCDIVEMLFSAIQSLVSEKHMHQALNISRLSKAKFIPALFNFCKIHLTSGGQQQILLSKQAAESMVNIIRIFAGAPPASALLDDIVKVLLMLHRPSNSFVTHDRSKFYFLLSSSTQQKTKKNGLPITARKLSLIIRKSPKSSTDSILQRSTSLDQRMNNAPSDRLHREFNVQKNSSEETIMEVYPHHKQISDRTKYKFNHIGQSKSSEGSSNGFNSDKRTNINLNPNDKAKLERALSQLNRGRNKRLRKVRIKNKGRQRTLTDCETERDLKSKRRRKRSVSDSGIDLALFREYDIIADEELRKISGIIDVSDREDRYDPPPLSPSELSQGIIQIQNGLLELLRDFIMILPDTAIEEVLSHYVTFDIVLILANNQNACVRSSIIRLLAVMCERYNNCAKNIYFFHLGNQISLYKAEFSLVQCCVQWITGSLQSIDQLIQSGNFKVAQKFGLNPLIAIIPQTVHDISLAKSVFDFLCQLYNRADHEISSYIIDNGLIPAITKALARVYIKWGNEDDKLIDKIEELFCLIGRKAIATAGCINVLWDLLNSIAYIEQNKGGATYRGIRSTQATVLLHLIQSFFPKQNNPSNLNFKLVMCDINLDDSALSASEKRTRLELLLDRTVQFVRAADLAHAQTSEEIKLIEAIVTLSMSGFSRGGTVIPWSFLPSNPMPLKLFIIKQIWKHTKNGDYALIGCDPKLVKAMIHSFWLNDGGTIPKADVQVLENVCRALSIQQNAPNSYIPQAILKMDLAREGSLKEQKPSVDRTVYKFDSLAMSCVESAMKITRYVVEMQNSERRNAIAYIRVHDENCLKDEWNSIIDRMTHEGAPWYSQRTTMHSWELDPTEGPTRIRIRMRRCNLDIPSKFLLNDSDNRRNENYQLPLGYLKETLNQRPSCTFYDQVLHTFSCKHLQVDLEYEGDLIITETNLIFIPTDDSPKPTINVNVNAIVEVWLRRYQHFDNAVEFFLETNTSIFLIFQSANDREILKMYFADKILQYPEAKLNVITQQWREGQITNWEYLMTLNLISGRTYQDLMQYPVFPWILSDYESSTLDLNGIENYRILSKPIAIQHSSNESHYVNSYNYLNSLHATSDSHQLAPYHYGSHYSNSGTVLHFLVRILPFTRYFLHYQDNNFDLPDRTFHSIVTTWRLASRDSTTDVKELIPEFFSFPEFLDNAERFNFGVRQSGEFVDNVELPPWARDSQRLFIFIHRQALESDIVRRNLHKWIDLVFGWRQSGQPAVEAINVFHPATYYGFSASKIADPVERSAMETMVRTYGQMPKMLFKSPHPAGQSLYTGTENETVPIMKHIKGLHWGCYTGSMDLPDPHVCCLYQQFDVNLSHLMALPNTNVIYAFSDGHNVMQGNEPDTMNLIQWKQSDSIVRIKPLRDGEFFDKKPLTYNHHIDDITACGTDPNFNQLWFGHESGRITVYKCNNSTQQSKYNNHFILSAPFNRLSHNSALRKISMKFSNFNGETDFESSNINSDTIKWKDPVILIRHTNTVTTIHISKEFKIAVSVACDGYAIIWDANNLNMVRSIQRPSICKSPISLVTVSPTLGDIVTVHDLFRDGQGYEDDRYSECCEATENIDDFVNVSVDMNGKSLLRLHTINAKYISHITIPEKILSVCYSYIKEGTGVNVIATGLENGIVRLWSSIDLSMIREFMVSTYDVLSLTYSTHQHLAVLTSDNIIQVWDSQGLHGNPPKFPQVVFQKRNSV